MASQKTASSLINAILLTSLLSQAALAEPDPKPGGVVFDGPLENVVLSEQQPGEHRVWVNDWQGGLYARAVLFDSASGEVLGSVETGWEGVKLDIPRNGDVVYNSALYMSRGYHGERTDVLEFFNRLTLQLEGEIVLPPKAGRGLPNTNHSDLSDDDRFLFLTFFTPSASVGIVDLESRQYVGEIETAGCAYVMAAGERRFFSLCGDGSILSVDIDDTGRELSRKRYSALFDAVVDPLHGTAVRAGNYWYFVTHLGVVHSIDVGGKELKHKILWEAGAKSGDQTAWVPAEMFQNLAHHESMQRLYVLLGDQSLVPKGGGTDYHRQSGTEVWVFDINTGQRVERFKLPEPMFSIAVSQDDSPLLYASSMWLPKVYVFDAVSGKELRQIETAYGSMNTIIQPVEPR
jgi:methylamine dehydrogenase heavy chain